MLSLSLLTYPDKDKKSLWVIDRDVPEATRQIHDRRYDFEKAISCVIDKSLYVF